MPTRDVQAALSDALKRADRRVMRGMDSCGQELERAAREVLSGARTGRMLHGHRASAPGEAPARLSGGYMRSFHAQPTQRAQNAYIARLYTDMQGRMRRLEHGGGGVAARPHIGRIRDLAIRRVRENISKAGW